MGTYQGRMGMKGTLGVKHFKAPRTIPWQWKIKNYTRPAFIKGWLGWHAAHFFSQIFGSPILLGSLHVKLIKRGGPVIDLGLASCRVVTTAFVNEMVDQLQAEDSTWGDFKYHDSGVGTTAEAVGDTDMETTDGESRATGTQTENAANIYESVATISYTTTKAITEHGVFNASTSGELMDRSVFSAVNVVNGDSIQFTYRLTCTAGS